VMLMSVVVERDDVGVDAEGGGDDILGPER